MFISKVTLCIMLIACQNYCTTGTVFSSPATKVSSQYLERGASNQQSPTNEHFHSTSPYDESTQTEYINDNEKYQKLVDRLEIISKIESSIPAISVHDDGTLIEKETVVTKHWPDYNSYVDGNKDPRELVVNYRARSKDDDDDDDVHKEFFSEFKAPGKCTEKCQVKKASGVTGMLVTSNDDDSLTSYRSPLKRTKHFTSLDVQQSPQLHEMYNSLPVSTQIGQVSLTGLTQDRRLEPRSIYNEQHRNRRQLRFVPAAMAGLTHHQRDDRSSQPDNKQSIIDQSIRNIDPSIIHSLLGVFDKMHPIFNPSFRRIKPNHIVVVPPRYIDDAKILPGPFYPAPATRLEDTQSSMKNTPRNPSGFGESERVLTTDITDSNERQPQIIQEHFLPTVPPSTIPKIANTNNNEPIHHSHEQLPAVEEEEYYPKNHQMPQVEKSMLSTGENLHHHHQPHQRPETGGQRESYKHHSKDTKYERYAANYSFKYHVTDEESENDFGHHETRNEQITDGNYHVRLPDGRIQRVNYYVDETGYHAKVSYEFDDRYYQKQAERNTK